MVVLLVGGGSRLMDLLIEKFDKMDWKVYVLTGQRDRTQKYKRALEQYCFPYDNECVKDIMRSLEPDLVLFTGAFDTNFNWEDLRQNSIHYISGLINVLSMFALNQKGRFVYLSSEEVFSGRSYSSAIPEDATPSAVSQRGLALIQGENLCLEHNRGGARTMVLRLDHLYYIPNKEQPCHESCFQKCVTGLRTGSVPANSHLAYSMLHVRDAVELIYQAATAKEPRYNVYHISSMQAITDMQLAEYVREKLGGAEIVDNTVGQRVQLALSSRRYQEEFHFQIRNEIPAGVQELAGYLDRHKEDYVHIEDADAGFRGRTRQRLRKAVRAAAPFLENLIFFPLIFWLNRFTASSACLERLDIYLLYVLLFAIVHGQQQAILSAVLSVIGFCFLQPGAESAFDVLLDSNTYIWIAHLFILGMVVGYMRDRLRENKAEAEERIRYLNEQVSDMVDINDSNARIKLAFEDELINQEDSLGKVYEITTQLNQYQPDEVLFQAARAVACLMECKDVAIYRVASGGYARLISATSKRARKLGNSIRYTDMTALYDDLKANRVFVNRALDKDLPLMSAPIYSGEKMEMIVMVWDLTYERMNLSQANKLAVISLLAQNAVIRANDYLEVLENERFLPHTRIMRKDAFSDMTRIYFNARTEGLCQCVVLQLPLDGRDELEAGQAVSKVLRLSDYVGAADDGCLYVLLTNTDRDNAWYVTSRLEKQGFKCFFREEAV